MKTVNVIARPNTARLYLNMTINSGYLLDVISYSFRHRSSPTGYANYNIYINNIFVGSGSIFVSSSTTLQTTGMVNVANAIAGISGTVTVRLDLYNRVGPLTQGTFRMDDFVLNGYTTTLENWSPAGYRYGFQNQEQDSETGLVNYKYRMHDPRVGRFFAVDPLASSYPWNSTYAFSENVLIDHVELEGLEKIQYQTKINGKYGNKSELRDATCEEIELYKGNFGIKGETNKDEIWRITSHIVDGKQTGTGFERWENKGGRKLNEHFSAGKTIKIPIEGSSNVANITLVGALSTGEAASGVAMTSTLATTTVLAIPLLLTGDEVKHKEPPISTYYRAMSWEEYSRTGGLLSDRKTKGEGPHIRYNKSYLINAKFIQTGNYDIIVKYHSISSPTFLSSTPFKFSAGSGKGGPIFKAARNAGMWYLKIEGSKGISYGFPGNSTIIFNGSLVAPPVIENILK
ncbi:MAG: hypothetical protein RL264_198 [Bacteroidota bacterium]|jgi:RHS repeat-associated protein